MKQSKVKPIALYLDRGFVFLCNKCNRFFRFNLWFLFLILCTYKCKYQKGKNEAHSTSVPVLEAFFFSFLKSYKSDFSCSSILLSLIYGILDYAHIVLMSFITFIKVGNLLLTNRGSSVIIFSWTKWKWEMTFQSVGCILKFILSE